MNKAKVIIAILILIAGLFGYAIGKYSTRIFPTTNITQLNLPYEQIEISGIDNIQQKQTEDFINKFYEYQQQKEIDKVLALFTPPANKQEQDDLNFLLGTPKYNYTLGGYYIRGMERHNDTTTVLVDEMRVIYSGGEYVGFSANIANLTLETTQTQNGVKIVSYKHNSKAGKYEGFDGY
ncbi:hypothetical protein A2773_01560 [Candidatus Gottesmanbacteria bacterium RIFCSPHIGHO2_01_FULL_39_10]|uniref:Uncharacterized protein n=1 Tax=Candidatus Gottesmanbacteria bacterium RIFCSPHIGHO2_01_FULL_39_10 TaxID=1798375 RepID=A0A1F5ZNY1_9BACT|nr:MAG: hypothetical protein A2773_01560 [Candidatus Gottesmanbacteria bacterium RIFCSPHIGHO2_01_FULL_39_10]